MKVDESCPVLRNSGVTNPASVRQPLSAPESHDPAVLVDVLVLSSDLLLFEAIRGAIGERNPVWRARSAEESVDLLLTGRCGVLLVDMAAVSAKPATLISQIVEQFPDVVVVVAGRREDETLLAQLISDGLVYRFMHKPLTAKRAGMFLQAAIRRHVEQRESHVERPLLPLAAVLPARFDPRKWLFVAAGLLLFVGLLALLAGVPQERTDESAATASPPPVPAVVSTSPQADPVLSRARAAYAAGRYEAPAGRNALDLYAAVLLARPSQAEARAGLDHTIDRIVSLARLAAADGNETEAKRLLARVQSVDPSSLAVQRLAAHLAPQIPTTTEPPVGTNVPSLQAANGTTPLASVGPMARNHPLTTRARRIAIPDPLTPRVANADELRASQRHLASADHYTRSFGAPISSGLPTAGYVKTRRPDPVVSDKSSSLLDAAAAAALAMPADQFDRVYATNPVYPPDALRNHVEGWVELTFTITETGAVSDIEVVDAQPKGVFEEAAIDALSSWRFRPRLANGHPVAHRSTVTLRFNVDG